MNAAAAAGGAAARVAVDRMTNWLVAPQQQQVQRQWNMQPLRAALPATPRGTRGRRGRGRGRRGRPQAGRPGGQPSAGVNTQSGSNLVIRDTEMFPIEKGFKTYSFNPSCDKLTRLALYEKMYQRYRIKYMNISYKSGAGTATAGNISVGICVGKKLDKVTADNITALRPFFYVPAWKNDSLTLGKDVDTSRYMLCGDDTADGVSFTLYTNATDSTGLMQISYEVEFMYPHPF